MRPADSLPFSTAAGRNQGLPLAARLAMPAHSPLRTLRRDGAVPAC